MGTSYLYCNYSYSSRTSLSTRKLPDPLGVGLRTYPARTFHVTLLSGIIKGRQGPLQNIEQYLREYKPPHRT